MLVSAKEFLHTIQKCEMDRQHLMIGLNDMANDTARWGVGKVQGLDFYFIFPELQMDNGSRVLQLVLRKPDAPEVIGSFPAVKATDVMKMLAH
jgi:hypothetical protein